MPANQVCPNSGNGLEACTGCVCVCPSRFDFIADADHPATLLDQGWTGLLHDAKLISDAKLTVSVTGCTSPQKPCGTCTFTGPVDNVDADTGDINNRRCTNDTSIRCTTDASCTVGGGTCKFYVGSYLPLSAGGISTCVGNEVAPPVTGTSNITTGATASLLNLIAHVYLGPTLANPCPRCVGDASANDGVAGGTCDAGTRAGMACDVNGTSPIPSFGSTSLDCPPPGLMSAGNLALAIASSTGVETRTLSAASPSCRAASFTGLKCFCDTCNNAAATPCSSNADCVTAGASVCGGTRCLGGGNAGVPCSVASECPGDVCGVPGTATQPNACDDGTCTSAGGDEGECAAGPVDMHCAIETFRACTTNGDCPAPGDTCVTTLRECFTDNGTIGNSITATGVADPPVFEASNPTLASLVCVGPTTSAAVNGVTGLPGPGRLTLSGLGRGLP
ncbi:MAG: hypothetical protein HY271_15670 [Deltaproteobacteria bacterium]|nr:hypothetical protein [Deltaproteobacteria bacterium]